MYCSQLWFISTRDSLLKLRTSYNTVLRRLLCISLLYSASQIFVSRGIPTFDELLGKAVYNFAKRIERSRNVIISFCLSAFIYVYSPIRKVELTFVFIQLILPGNNFSNYLELFLISLCM